MIRLVTVKERHCRKEGLVVEERNRICGGIDDRLNACGVDDGLSAAGDFQLELLRLGEFEVMWKVEEIADALPVQLAGLLHLDAIELEDRVLGKIGIAVLSAGAILGRAGAAVAGGCIGAVCNLFRDSNMRKHFRFDCVGLLADILDGQKTMRIDVPMPDVLRIHMNQMKLPDRVPRFLECDHLEAHVVKVGFLDLRRALHFVDVPLVGVRIELEDVSHGEKPVRDRGGLEDGLGPFLDVGLGLLLRFLRAALHHHGLRKKCACIGLDYVSLLEDPLQIGVDVVPDFMRPVFVQPQMDGAFEVPEVIGFGEHPRGGLGVMVAQS